MSQRRRILLGIITVMMLMFGAVASARTKKLVLGFSQIGAESGWRTAETASIKAAAKKAKVKLKFSDAQQKQENQLKAIRAFIAQRVDVIAVAPVVESGWDTALQEAKRAGIPVIIVDRTIKVADDSLYSTFIGSDFPLEGENAAKEMASLLKGKGNIVELQGTVGSSAQVDRLNGFAKEISKHRDIKMLASQSGNFTIAKGKEVMESFLKKYGNKIDGLYAHNDDMALGAIQAIEEYGLKPGKDIKIVSIDGVKGIFEAMADGKANVTVECNPLLGPQIMKAAKELAAGKTLPKWIKSDEGIYRMDVAKRELPNRKY